MSQDITLENHISLIQIELQKNDFKRALDLCLVALDSFPSNPKLLINCGNIFKILGNSSRAVDYYKKSLDYFESKEAYNNLSVIYIESNKNEDAIDMAKRAIEIDPGYEDAFYNLSLAQHRQEDFKNAIKNAGAIYTDLPAVIDSKIVTTAHYKDLGPWMKAALDLYYKEK